MNLETTRPRGRPRNRWQDEVREDGEEWQEKVGMGESPENGKESLHSAHANGMNECTHDNHLELHLKSSLQTPNTNAVVWYEKPQLEEQNLPCSNS
jgi:hypothetical protein